MPKHKKSSIKRAPKARSETSLPSALPLGVLAGAALIIIAVFLAYFPSINGGFVMDDDKLLTNNILIKASNGLYHIWCTSEAIDYWPVTNTTFWIEWRMWRMNPTGYHVTNLILHIADTLLIWIILRKLSVPGAFLAAAIFAVHPVNVESVAWIASRKNLLAMLFFLLSILCYLKHFSLSCSDNDQKNRWYWLSLAAFVLAMLSKASVAILPVLLLGIVWWLRTAATVPFFAGDCPLPSGKNGTVPFRPAKMGLSPLSPGFRTYRAIFSCCSVVGGSECMVPNTR